MPYAAAVADRPPELAHDPMYLPLALSVGAGFKFGCGLMLAAALTAMLLFLMASIAFFVATLVGIPLPIVPAR